MAVSTGTAQTRDAFSLRIPDDWNGQVVTLLRGPIAQHAAGATPGSYESAATALLDYQFAVAIPSGRAGGTAGVSASGGRLQIHFVVGIGSPTSAYLVGLSRGEHVALATVGATTTEPDQTLVYAPGGFMHVASPALRDSGTIELALQSDERVAALLGQRLGVDRRSLAHTLDFYYALLTGVRNEPAAALIAAAAVSPR
ncbi:MAG: hypothetical protein EA382_06860 [Spirochaetaceae bacterium]|nr:MAG: hypothetical protein EA382_06860 [Spirochaetaceae bacterium]